MRENRNPTYPAIPNQCYFYIPIANTHSSPVWYYVALLLLVFHLLLNSILCQCCTKFTKNYLNNNGKHIFYNKTKYRKTTPLCFTLQHRITNNIKRFTNRELRLQSKNFPNNPIVVKSLSSDF